MDSSEPLLYKEFEQEKFMNMEEPTQINEASISSITSETPVSSISSHSPSSLKKKSDERRKSSMTPTNRVSKISSMNETSTKKPFIASGRNSTLGISQPFSSPSSQLSTNKKSLNSVSNKPKSGTSLSDSTKSPLSLSSSVTTKSPSSIKLKSLSPSPNSDSQKLCKSYSTSALERNLQRDKFSSLSVSNKKPKENPSSENQSNVDLSVSIIQNNNQEEESGEDNPQVEQNRLSLSSSSSQLSESQKTKICSKCQKSISGKYVEVGSKIFHYSCSSCKGCKKMLSEPYFDKDGDYYCNQCYCNLSSETAFTLVEEMKKCSVCGELTQNFITFNGVIYHEHCFKCTNCGNSLKEKVFLVNGKPICKDCKDKSKLHCFACKKVIVKNGLQVDGVLFHPRCLRCSNCKQEIPKIIQRIKEKVYCKDCVKVLFGIKI